MQKDTQVQTLTLAELVRRVKGQWKTGLIALLVTVVACLGVGAAVGTSYTATAVLTVSPLTTNPFSTAAVNQQINIATERAILGSGEVARMAATRLGEDISAATLAQKTSIEAPQGSQVLSVSVMDRDPQRAARHANALATAYLDFRSKGAQNVANNYIATIDKRIANLDAAAKNGSVDSIVLADLVNQRNDLSLVAENPGRIIGVADGSAATSTPALPIYLAAGLFAGLIVGLVATVFRDRMSGKAGTAERLAAHTGRPVLRMEDSQDMEGIRWIIRSLRIGSRPLRREDPTAVGILSLGKAAEARFRAAMTHVLESQQVPCHSDSLAAIAPGVIDRGWPTPEQRRKWSGENTVLIGIPPGIEGARVAVLGDRFFSSVVLFVDASVKLANVEQQLAVVDGLPPDAVCLVFVEKHQKRGNKNVLTVNRDPAANLAPVDLEMDMGNASADTEEYSR